MQEAHFCPIHDALGKIGGKWKMLIIWHLHSTPQRFNELQRSVGGISTKVLSDQLKSLESDGLVIRQATDSRPPQVTYTLTEQGKKLQPIMQQLYDWSVQSHAAEYLL